MRRRRWAPVIVGGVVLVTAGCQPNDAFTLFNDSDQSVVVQLVGGPTPLVAARLAPHGHAVTHLGGLVAKDNCADQEYRAVAGSGQVLDRLTRECRGQTWHICTH